MSKYRLQFRDVIEFDGDRVEVVFRPLSVADSTAITSDVKDDMATNIEVLRKNLISMRGLTDADGGEVTAEVVFRDFYFLPLVGKMIEMLMATGDLPKGKDRPSQQASTGS